VYSHRLPAAFLQRKDEYLDAVDFELDRRVENTRLFTDFPFVIGTAATICPPTFRRFGNKNLH